MPAAFAGVPGTGTVRALPDFSISAWARSMIFTRKKQMLVLFVCLTLASLWLVVTVSPWWLILTLLLGAVAASNAKSLPARKITKFGVELLLFEPPTGLSFSKSFSDVEPYVDSQGNQSTRREPVALRGSFGWMRDIAERVVGTFQQGKYTTPMELMAAKGARMRRDAEYFRPLKIYCAACETKMADAFKANALAQMEAEHVGADPDRYILIVPEADAGGEPMPTRDGRCPRCSSENALFVWIP
jgi:hypothetical protein